MIRSTKISTKFANTNKKENISILINEYRRCASLFVDILWEMEKVPTLVPKDITSQINTWLSSRMVQCCAKQSSGIVRGTKAKQNKRLYIYNKFLQEGKYKKARKIKSIIDNVKISKPNVNNIIPNLDNRFIKIDTSSNTSFDGFLVIKSIGNKIKINIPFKKTKHFNNLSLKGKLNNGIRLSNKDITFIFEIDDILFKQNGEIVGLDVGILNGFTLSTGDKSIPCRHGHTLKSIQEKLSRKKKGSIAFNRAQKHRTNYINYTINQINFNNIKQLNVENIKNIRYKSNVTRYLSHWTYTTIFEKLVLKCEDTGVQIKYINPTYTSQRCSLCGWTRKINRNGKQFKCTSCGFECDADLNASKNISFNLLPIDKKERLLNKNRKGFYWNLIS